MNHSMEDGREVVARGRIRVDARRALAKLREHLLIDLHLYATEIARAAIAAKAKNFDIDYDANDVILTFDGQPAAPNELPRLLDHVLGDGQSTDRHLRGLALGINAALGLDPAYIDIFVRREEDERVAKVRFVPSVLESENVDLPEIDWVSAPKGMPEQGTRVQFHRRIGVNLLKRAATRETPREIILLADALHVAPLQLTSRNGPFASTPRPRTLLRVPFRDRDFRRGMVEILETPAGSQIEWLEHGVTLVRKTFVPEPILPSTPHAQVEMPIRVTIDADELPTNASRSSLREDVPWTSRAEHAARESLVVALQSLVTLVTRQGKPLPNVEVVDADPQKLENALGAVVCVVAGAWRRSAQLSEQALALLDLPLLHNALGQPMSPNAILRSSAKEVFVHQGKEPHEADLEPWLGDVVWLRGKMVERLLFDFGVQDAKPLVAQAHVARERRRILHARPPSEPSVPPEPGHLVKETFRMTEGAFAGFRGQLALGAEGQGTGQRPTSVRIYVEGRHIDTLTIDRDKLPLCMDAAIAWDGKLMPKFSYEGVSDGPLLRLAIWQLTRLALVALGMYFERSIQEKRPPEERNQVLPIARAAIGAFVTAAKSLGVDQVPEEIPLSAYAPVWTRGIWLSANQTRLPVSLAELKTYSDRTKAICYVGPRVNGTAPDGRPVVVLTNLEKEWLALVFPDATFVPYERGLRVEGRPAPDVHFAELLRWAQQGPHAETETLPSMPFELREGRGILAPAIEDQCLSLHAGVMLAKTATNKFVEPATIVLEHDAIVPNPTWDGILWTREASTLIHVRNDFLEKVVAALEGNLEARQALRHFPSKPGPVLRAFVIEAVARYRTKELGTRIEKLPLVQMLDDDARPRFVSLAEVAALFPDPKPIPFLRAIPPFPTLDWQPLFIEHDREISALTRWAGHRVKNAEDELEQRSKLALGEMQKRAFLQKPRLRINGIAPLADLDIVPKVWQEQPDGTGEPVAAVVAALPRKGLDLPSAHAEIAYEERLVCTRPLLGLMVPVVVRVFLPSNRDLIAYGDVTPEGMTRIEGHAYSAACLLATDLIARADTEAACAAVFEDRRIWLLIRQLYLASMNNPSRSDILTADFALRAATFFWPTVQGKWRPYGELVPGGKKLYYATSRYEKWEPPIKGPSELDYAILYLPPTTEGTLVREVLGCMGHDLVDVSSAIYALQSRRKPGSGQSGPTLGGSPVHPALRTSLASLGLDEVGEIELTDGTRTDVHVETLHGTSMRLEVNAPISFRAVVRSEDIELSDEEKKKLAEKLAKGAIKLIESLAERLGELPLFVRVGLRVVVVKYAGKGKNLSKRRQSFEVFPDVLGRYHSIASLTEATIDAYPYVTIVPTQPISPRPRPPLCLTPDEVHALSNYLQFEDVTERLRRAILGAERRRAAPVEHIGLSTTQRLECLDVVPFEGDGIEGEVGVLCPENAEKRGIWVYKNRRSLCRLSESMGWPVLAIVNDDSIPENKTFDGIKGGAPKDKLRQQVRIRAESMIAKWRVLPNDILAGRTVSTKLMNNAVTVIGALWLPPSWLTAGSVEIRDSSNRFPAPRTFGAPQSSKRPNKFEFVAPIPICGRLFVANTGSAKKPQEITAALSAWLLEETMTLALDAVASNKDPRAAEGYQWILKFFGADVGKLEARAADGRTIDSEEIISTLASKREIWVTTRVTDIEGQFPSGMPSFILRGDGQALVDVLRARTNFVRELAATPKPNPQVMPQAVTPAPVFFQPDKLTSISAPPAPAQVELPPAPEVTVSEEANSSEREASWFRSLIQRVVVFFDRPEPLEPWTKELGPSLMLAIDKLGLTVTSVVKGVRYVRRGRPMVFEEATGELVVNRSHSAVRSLAARASSDPRARILLVVLAVREINRVLAVVTDATERRVLLSLLRGESL